MNIRSKLVMMCTIPLMGCATMKESLLLGTAAGGIAGAVINNSVDRDNSKAATNGVIAGAIIGIAASYFIHDGLEQRDSRVRRETLLNLDRFNVSRPKTQNEDDFFVTEPRVETQCFDADVRGNKMIEAHCESVIVDRPEWVKRVKKGNNYKRSE